jgi:hypothetical protein
MDKEVAVEAKRLADSIEPLRKGALRAATDAKRPQAERDTADRSMRELRKLAQQLESNLKGHKAVGTDASRVLELSGQAVTFAQGAGTLKPDATAALGAVKGSSEALAVAFARR